jgi:hypothetical protein
MVRAKSRERVHGISAWPHASGSMTLIQRTKGYAHMHFTPLIHESTVRATPDPRRPAGEEGRSTAGGAMSEICQPPRQGPKLDGIGATQCLGEHERVGWHLTGNDDAKTSVQGVGRVWRRPKSSVSNSMIPGFKSYFARTWTPSVRTGEAPRMLLRPWWRRDRELAHDGFSLCMPSVIVSRWWLHVVAHEYDRMCKTAAGMAINTPQSNQGIKSQQPWGGGGFCSGGEEEGGADHQVPPVGDTGVCAGDWLVDPTCKHRSVHVRETRDWGVGPLHQSQERAAMRQWAAGVKWLAWYARPGRGTRPTGSVLPFLFFVFTFLISNQVWIKILNYL